MMCDATKKPQALVMRRSVAPQKMGVAAQVCLPACARTSLLTLGGGLPMHDMTVVVIFLLLVQ